MQSLLTQHGGCCRQQANSVASCSATAPPDYRLQRLTPCARHMRQRARPVRPSRAVERDLDWEPDLKVPSAPPSRGSGGGSNSYSPPPPPPARTAWYEAPFASRRNIALSLLGGAAALWLFEHKVVAPIDSFGAKPPIDFTLAGYTDIRPEDFVYFKTPGGRWVAAAEDEQGRFLMIDEVGDLYYDSGDPQIGLYAMDTRGNLFNFYRDVDGEQKITPVGNVSDLQKFKINEIAGIKLDRDVTVVAFRDGSTVPLPPGSSYVDALTGQVKGPDQLIEGMNGTLVQRSGPSSNPFESLLGGGERSVTPPLQRYEVDLADPRDYTEQMFDQTFLPDPEDGSLLPGDFDIEALGRQVMQEAAAKGK